MFEVLVVYVCILETTLIHCQRSRATSDIHDCLAGHNNNRRKLSPPNAIVLWSYVVGTGSGTAWSCPFHGTEMAYYVLMCRKETADSCAGIGGQVTVGAAVRCTTCVYRGDDAHPLGTHGRVAHAVKTEDEQTL